MKLCLATVALLASMSVLAAANKEEAVKGPLQFKMKDIDGKEVALSDYKGKVVLIVNVASKCGNTPQYKTLEALYEKNKDAGLVIIGVPANEFGKQEPGTDAEIKEFCTSKYNVTFPMMSKVVVKGDGIAPLYKFLTEKETNPNFAGPITWNFEKFLINRKGEVVKRFTPKTKPDSEDVMKAVKAELDAK
jgi:glutathione peroxidase